MNEPDVTTAVRDVVASVLSLPADQVTPHAHFYDELGGDSLQKLEVIAHIESHFDCRLSDEEAATSDTVEALASQVAQHVS
ncbi:MAG: acyl carrier protein [Actinoallomurus sp.]